MSSKSGTLSAAVASDLQVGGSRTTLWSRLSLKSSTELQVAVALAALFTYFAVKYSATFLADDNFLNMSRVAGILLVVAIGQMFALVVGGFDISVASNMGFVSTVVALRLTDGHPVADAVVWGLGAGALIGLANGILIAAFGVTPFVATLGMLGFLQGFGNEISNGQSIGGLNPDFQYFGGAGDWGFLPSAVGIALVVLVLAWLVLARLRAGLYIYAIGGSRETARVAGVPVVRYEILAYTTCGFLAGVAGVMLSSRVTVGQASLGAGYDLLSIATAVIGGVAIGGGIGKLRGVVLGVCLLTVLTTGMDIATISSFTQQMITGAVLIAAVLIAKLRGVQPLANLKAMMRRSGGAVAGRAAS